MATAKKLPSGQWRALVYSHKETVNGKQKRIYESFTAPTKKEAEYMAAEYALNKKRNKSLKLTVIDAINSYIDNKEHIISPSTVKQYRSYAKNYYTSIRDIPLESLKNEHIQIEINNLAKGRSPKTVSNIYGLLSAAVSTFYPDFRINVTLPKKQKHEMTLPHTEEIKRMLECSYGTSLYLPIIFAFSMGLRRGEISGLKWSDVDLQKRTIHIHTAIVLNDKNEWVSKQPKSYEGNRILDIPDIVYDELLKLSKNISPDDNIFPYLPSAISNGFRRMKAKLGIQNIRFHDLRHYYASIMLSVNVPDKYAMKRMGHATNAVLKNVYQHLIDEKDKEVTDSINAYLRENF